MSRGKDILGFFHSSSDSGSYKSRSVLQVFGDDEH